MRLHTSRIPLTLPCQNLRDRCPFASLWSRKTLCMAQTLQTRDRSHINYTINNGLLARSHWSLSSRQRPLPIGSCSFLLWHPLPISAIPALTTIQPSLASLWACSLHARSLFSCSLACHCLPSVDLSLPPSAHCLSFHFFRSLLVLALCCSQCGIVLSFSGDAIPVVTFAHLYFGITMFNVLYMLENDALAIYLFNCRLSCKGS